MRGGKEVSSEKLGLGDRGQARGIAEGQGLGRAEDVSRGERQVSVEEGRKPPGWVGWASSTCGALFIIHSPAILPVPAHTACVPLPTGGLVFPSIQQDLDLVVFGGLPDDFSSTLRSHVMTPLQPPPFPSTAIER